MLAPFTDVATVTVLLLDADPPPPNCVSADTAVSNARCSSPLCIACPLHFSYILVICQFVAYTRASRPLQL